MAVIQSFQYPPSVESQLYSKNIGWTIRELIFGVSLFLIIFLVVVEIKYIGADSASNRALAGQDVLDAAGGDRLRQIYYILIFFAAASLHVYFSGFKNLVPISGPYNVACIWCLVSSLYAIVPGISLRRSIGMYIILLSVGWCVQQLGTVKTLKVLRYILAFIIISSFASVLLSKLSLFSYAVHPDDEMDVALQGAWRGIMPHKNVAGAVMTHGIIFFSIFFTLFRRKFDLLMAIGAFVFLFFTKSKTSTGLALFVLLSAFFYLRIARLRSPALFNFVTGGALLIIAVFITAGWYDITVYFHDPESLSGRVAIWQSVIPYIGDHFWLGSGYGSFWMVGYSSPIFDLALTEFITTIGHSHNGYIEILLSTGFIGLSLALFSLLVVPYYRFSKGLPDSLSPLYAALFGMWLFGMLQNLTEAQFFSPDKQSWIFVVVAITIVHHRSCSTYHMAERK